MTKKEQLLALLFIAVMTVVLGFTSVSRLQEEKQASAWDTYVFLHTEYCEDL